MYLDQENRRKNPDQNIYSQWTLNKSAKMNGSFRLNEGKDHVFNKWNWNN